MAKDSSKVIPFPNSIAKEDRIRMREARLDELELENAFLHQDKNTLDKRISSNAKEIKELLKELAILCDFETEQEVEFMPDFETEDDMDFDFDFDFNPDNKGDK